MTRDGSTPRPWAYRPRQDDDWGVVRGGPVGEFGQGFICQALDPLVRDEDQLSAHRIAKTDPWQANARRIVAAVNATSDLPIEALEADVVRKLVEAVEAFRERFHGGRRADTDYVAALMDEASTLAKGEAA